MNFGKLKEFDKNSQTFGLSVCKHLIQKMGGNVSVDCQPEIGTIFKINL